MMKAALAGHSPSPANDGDGGGKYGSLGKEHAVVR